MSQNIDEKITSSDVALNSQENLGFDIQNQEKKDQRKKIIINIHNSNISLYKSMNKKQFCKDIDY